jgi:mannose-6-phosphate isomerase-like protein (cupin superfamily)
MAEGVKPIRRVVTGNDAQGRSKVLFDSAAPNVNPNSFKKGTGMTDIWVFHDCPAAISGEKDDGNLPFHFEPPQYGGHLRIVQSDARPADYDAATDSYIVPVHPPKKTAGGTWERGSQNLYTTRTHKSETIDYGILLSGERTLILDDGEYHLKPGDCVIQLASWHAWRNINAGTMAFVFVAARFEDGHP